MSLGENGGVSVRTEEIFSPFCLQIKGTGLGKKKKKNLSRSLGVIWRAQSQLKGANLRAEQEEMPEFFNAPSPWMKPKMHNLHL